MYYGLIASDVYISESRFVIRSPQRPVSSGIFGDILQGTGITRSQDDTYSVRDFILSRDALKELDQKLGVRNAFENKKIDFINRFPGLDWDNSFEEFYRYYGKHIGVDYDPVSSISILTVHAYTAEDAKKINDLLLQMSERLVNTLNDRSRQDLIRFSEDEVKVAADKAKDASAALFSFRSQHSIFEPDKQAAIQLAGVAKIQEELIGTEAELAQLKKLSPNNPQIGALESRAETLRKAIASEASKVTSASGSFSAQRAKFRTARARVHFRRQTARYRTGGARNRTQRGNPQAAVPGTPCPAQPAGQSDGAQTQVRSVFTVFMLGLIAWGVASLIIASVREHSE